MSGTFLDRELQRVLGQERKTSDVVEASLQSAYETIRKSAAVRRRRPPVWKTVVILAAAAAVCAATVWASIEIYRFTVEKDGYALSVTLAQSADRYVQYGEMEFAGYTLVKGNAGAAVLKYHSDEGWNAGKNLMLQLYRVDQEIKLAHLFTDVADWEEIEADGLQILCLRENGVMGSEYAEQGKTSYGQRALVVDEESGYFVYASAMNGLPREEFVALLSRITLVPCTQEEAPAYLLASSLQQASSGAGAGERIYQTDRVIQPGQTVSFQQAEFTLEQAEVFDSLASVSGEQSAFGKDAWLALPEVTDENGTILPYDRETVVFGDGVNSPGETVAEVRVTSPKLVVLTIRVKNTAEEASEICINQSLAFLRQDGSVWKEQFFSFHRPEAVQTLMMDDRGCYFRESDGGKGRLFKWLEPGEEEVYHVGYLVDDDLLGEAYYNLSMNSSEVMPQDACLKLFAPAADCG